MNSSYYGRFGGQYMPELLINPILKLEQEWELFKKDALARADLQKECGTTDALDRGPSLCKSDSGTTHIFETRRLAPYGCA